MNVTTPHNVATRAAQPGSETAGPRVFVGRRRRGELASMSASVPRGWGRAAVAIVAALAAVCVSVPAAQAMPWDTEIAIQANTGILWTWTQPGASDTGLGMKAGTSPSIAGGLGLGSNHEIAFQANTGYLWTTGAGGGGRTPYGMMAGTSPSADGGYVAFQANTGDLWEVGPSGKGDTLGEMMAGTSPSVNGSGEVAYHDTSGTLGLLQSGGDSGLPMRAGTSPSISDYQNADVIFYQGTNGDLWWTHEFVVAPVPGSVGDTGLGMRAGTSPSVNDQGAVAFQANTGDLLIMVNFGTGGTNDTGVKMMAGTSPSIDDHNDVAYQGTNGDLWIWEPGGTTVDTGMGMMAGTSPSISRNPVLGATLGAGAGNGPVNGGPGNNLISGGQGNDVIRGGAGNDTLYGGPGNDRIYGGPGNDRIYGGPGNDRIYGGPGNDQIVDRRGATIVFPGSGTNRVDVADGRGDDRVVCAPGSINHIVADPGDRVARGCRGKGSTVRYIRVRQHRSMR
jgi:Ca2+-binding RTX toxin-like protein